ncbi:MAG TPA: acyl-CoA dehydrogenase family protein, partial [Ilumatobacteraceae bacterium]|jgi:hypothetical protein
LADASIVIEVADGHAHRATVDSDIERVDTLGGEPWGRASLSRGEDLGPVDAAMSISQVALAAYLAGAGDRLLRATAEYAIDRVQFRTAIGAFQGVAHPIAEISIRLAAARTLARLAAWAIDRGDPGAAAMATTARLSAAQAALAMSYQSHQTFGAMGFTLEGPVAAVSARVRQLAMLLPHPAAMRDTVLAAHGL